MQKFENNRIKKIVYISLVIVGFVSSIILLQDSQVQFLVRKMDKFWVDIHLPYEFKISTILILLSSVFMYLALKKAKANQTKKIINNLLLAMVLIIGFIFFSVQKVGKLIYMEVMPLNLILLMYMVNTVNLIKFLNEVPVNYDGENYVINDSTISGEKELNGMKLFFETNMWNR